MMDELLEMLEQDLAAELKPGWWRGKGFWARKSEVHFVKGDYPSQDRYALSPRVCEEIAKTWAG